MFKKKIIKTLASVSIVTVCLLGICYAETFTGYTQGEVKTSVEARIQRMGTDHLLISGDVMPKGGINRDHIRISFEARCLDSNGNLIGFMRDSNVNHQYPIWWGWEHTYTIAKRIKKTRTQVHISTGSGDWTSPVKKNAFNH